jgi:Spy/CpxP family protein refolding chaperone
MARQTAWVLAFVISCAPALGAAAAEIDEQSRPDKAQSAPGAKDKPQPASPQGAAPQNASARPDDRDRWKWWLYNRAEFGITEQQSNAINQIFESTIPMLRESRQELDKADEALSRTIKEHKADLATVSGLLDRLENARSVHNKTRTLMLYRMHLVLSADQRQKVQAWRERQDAARKDKESSDGRRRHP